MYSERPLMLDIGFTLPDPYSSGDTRGQEFPFPDDGILVTDLFIEPSPDPFFSPIIKCPDNMTDYIKEISFILPTAFTEEDKASVTKVAAHIMRSFPDHSAFMTIDGSEVYTDPVYQALATIPLLEDDQESGSYFGSFSGLLCVSEKYPMKNFRLIKAEASGKPEGVYRLAEQLALHPLDSLDVNSVSYLDLTASMEIMLGYDGGKSGSAALTDFHIEDTSAENMASWPVNYFEKLTSYDGALYFRKQEDGSLVYNKYTRGLEELDLPLDGETVSLKMIPVTDYDPNIVILYAVYLKDGTVRYYEGGPY